MGRRREWSKRLNRSVWFATHRAARANAALGAAFLESFYVTRRGRTRVVRVECSVPQKFRVAFSDGVTAGARRIGEALRAMCARDGRSHDC